MADFKISVITVTKDDPSGLAKTLKSIMHQDHRNREVIVADGGKFLIGSENFREFGKLVNQWVYGPDDGIFDAMNKGLRCSTGEWILFLNSGDVFADNHVLGKLMDTLSVDQPGTEGSSRNAVNPDDQESDFASISTDPENSFSTVGKGEINPKKNIGVIYGDSVADYSAFKVYRRAGAPAQLWKGMFCNHQSMLFRRESLMSSGINIRDRGQTTCYHFELSITADHDLVFRLYASGIIFHYVPFPVAIWDTRGISNRKQVRSVAERFRMIEAYCDRDVKVKLYYLWLLFLAVLTQGMYRYLPANILAMLIRFVNRKSIVKQTKPDNR